MPGPIRHGVPAARITGEHGPARPAIFFEEKLHLVSIPPFGAGAGDWMRVSRGRASCQAGGGLHAPATGLITNSKHLIAGPAGGGQASTVARARANIAGSALPPEIVQ